MLGEMEQREERLQSYDKFADIEFFDLHPSYLPFVGNMYSKYRILQISESHYSDELDTSIYGIEYFEKWYEQECAEVEIGLLNRCLTRRVCGEYVAGNTYFQNFDNPLRAFRKIVLDKTDGINKYNRSDYNYFAFMNFYQIPAFKPKGYFSKAIIEQGKKEGCVNRAQELLADSRSFSTRIVDEVIEILDPRMIVFTSFDAADAYIENGGKHANEKNTIFLSHPNNPFPWSKCTRRLGDKKPREVFENALRLEYRDKDLIG